MNENTLMPKRVATWDNLKFVLIVLVVIGHFLDSHTQNSGVANRIFLFIYTFHMPLFVFVSGLFSKSTVRGDSLNVGRVYAFLVLYLALAALTYVLKLCFGQKADIELLGTYHVQWYMLVMAAFLLITYALRRLPPMLVFTVSIVLSCFAGYDPDIGNVLCLSKIVSFFPFFLAGYYLDSEKLLAFLRQKWVRLLACAVLAVFVFVVIFYIEWYSDTFRPLLILSTPGVYQKLPVPALGAINRLAYYGMVFLISFSIIALTPRKKTVFSTIGQRTLQIYFFHVPLLTLYFNLGVHAFLCAILPLPTTAILILVSLVVTAILSPRILGAPFHALMKIKTTKKAQ